MRARRLDRDRLASDQPDSLDRQFAHTPYACSFATTNVRPTTFILVTLHVDRGKKAADRIPELRAIAQWLADWAEQEHDWKHNVIALGDFNIGRADDDLYKPSPRPGSSHHPASQTFLARSSTNQRNTIYDQIA